MSATWESTTTFFVYTTQSAFLGNIFSHNPEEPPRVGEIVRRKGTLYRIDSVDAAAKKIFVSADSLVAIGIGQPRIWEKISWEVR